MTITSSGPAAPLAGGSMPIAPYAPSTMADIWLMATTMFTSTRGTNMTHASHSPMSSRIIVNIPRPPEKTATRDAESSVKITIGIT